ncbi:AEC family transporter [Acutalibacter sp. 1XD8-33]|uniref:AEC family transporter n=1 Tax=Acutalibacter sp. 1XD8-33 TaxID=2320081 RepID=UPI000EA1B855|nr:AEC family transporter [Acutalibacter sp. 1XD8-33]RKJ38276.1 AEC family transporter [Acutalibacter sp. 1XD8-33]
MEAILAVVAKVAVILILILVGYGITKRGMLTDRGASEITSLLIKVVTPCVIVDSFLGAADSLKPSQLLIALALPVLWMGIALALGLLAFRKDPQERKKVLRFAVTFSNTGFMGIPLVQGIVGDTGVIYASFGVVVFNVLCWTYGYSMMSGGERLNLKTLLLNPGIVGLAFGLPIYFFKLQLPALIAEPLGYLADLNTPLAMLVVGTYIAKADLHSFASDMSVYKASFLRLIAAPALYLLVLLFLRPEKALLTTTVIQAATPVAANTVLFAVQYKRDSELASKLVAVSTVLSVLTIPVMTVAAQMLAG